MSNKKINKKKVPKKMMMWRIRIGGVKHEFYTTSLLNLSFF